MAYSVDVRFFALHRHARRTDFRENIFSLPIPHTMYFM